MTFHIVREGRCWMDLPGMPRTELGPGEVVAFPLGDAHLMGSGDAPSVPVASLLPRPPWIELPMLRHGGDGVSTKILCTYLMFDEPVFHPLVASLPRAIFLRREDAAPLGWFESSISYLIEVSTRQHQGAAFLATSMTELLFLELIRLHLARLPPDGTGWLVALGDRYVGPVLHRMHQHPAHPWNVESLAREAGLSRSPLEARFNNLLGCSMMRYLCLWRLQLASRKLADGSRQVGAIAAEIGYRSEEAFSRAFKRHTGMAPTPWRRRHGGTDIGTSAPSIS